MNRIIYRTLYREMKKRGISAADLGKVTGQSERKIWAKLSGDRLFTLAECQIIHSALFPDMDFKVLFSVCRGPVTPLPRFMG